jgi:hypothetical protein
MNSKILVNWINQVDTQVGSQAYRHYKYNMDELPIPQISTEAQKPFEILVDYIIFAKTQNLEDEVKFFECVIDVMVHGLYFEESMKTHDCYINEEVANLIKPFGEYDSDIFKGEYIKSIYEIMNEDKAIKRGLLFSRNVPEVEIISGEKSV